MLLNTVIIVNNNRIFCSTCHTHQHGRYLKLATGAAVVEAQQSTQLLTASGDETLFYDIYATSLLFWHFYLKPIQDETSCVCKGE